MKRIYAGIDLHKKKFQVCFYDHGEQTKQFHEYLFNEKGIASFLSRVHDYQDRGYHVSVAVEMLTGSYYFYDALIGKVDEITVVNTNQFKVIAQSTKKTDRHDSELLAEYYARDLLPTIYIPSPTIRELRSLTSLRRQVVKEKSKCKNEIHALLLSCGEKIPTRCLSTRKHLEALKTLQLSSTVYRHMLDLLIDKLAHIEREIAEIHRIMEEVVESHEVIRLMVERIMSIPGVGRLSAIILTATIADISRFPSEKALAAYIGLVPRVRDSGESINHGRITKKGSSLARSILVQNAWALLKCKNGPFKEFYTALAYRSCRAKAIIAVARKIVTITYVLLKNNKEFDYTRYAVAVE